MKVLFAIIKQTVRAALRSRVVYVLLFLNLLAVFLLPLTVSGEGTAISELQVSLTYSLKAVAGLLSLAAVWLGCAGLAREIEAYNLHLVLTKPAARWVVWLGKWLGVLTMTGSIFIISAGIIFGLVMFNLKHGDFTEESLAKARSEVLVGRRVFEPDVPDFNRIARREYERMRDDGQLAPDHEPGAIISELARQIKAKSTEVQPRQTRVWRFRGLRVAGSEDHIYVRYRLYVGSTSVGRQRFTEGIWSVANPDAPAEERLAVLPQRVVGGSFHQFYFPAKMIADDGSVTLQYSNHDRGGESIIFQVADGPDLMVQVTGFAANYTRGVGVVLLRLALLAALGCAFGAAFSTPVAVFVAMSYLVVGAIADPSIGEPVRDQAGRVISWNIPDMLAHGAAVGINALVVSFDRFDVAGPLARGHLLELSHLGQLALFQAVLRGGPLIALGIWVLTKRELGKVIRR